MKKSIFLASLSIFCSSFLISSELQKANTTDDTLPTHKMTIIGGGILGALESYYEFSDAQKHGKKVRITVYEKSKPFTKSDPSDCNNATTNTAYNIVPSLTIDEILSVVPRGSEMVQKLAVLFSEPGGIRVDDVPGVNDSDVAMRFKEQVALYGTDENHDDRTKTLLNLGKMSMNLWEEMYERGDDELKSILEESNFNPCREPRNKRRRSLHDGYRIDLIYGIPNASMRASSMKDTYEQFGYKNCKILSPVETIAIDPSLSDFCIEHSSIDETTIRKWNDDCIALWRPGGCIDTGVFLPKFYDYLKKKMGTYKNKSGKTKDCFRIRFNREITGVIYDDPSDVRITGLLCSDGSIKRNANQDMESRYVFCPGEAVGTLSKLGFSEPAFAGFAGPSLILNIPVSSELLQEYQNFSHCMEVHKEGIVLAWQARIKKDKIFIGVAGTKAFYGDKMPNKNESFAKNRHLVQLNMINDVLPEFVSIALDRDTKGKELRASDLDSLESIGIAQRWVGRRSVAYDGFPTFGMLYSNGKKITNARCTTHCGSGGVSFSQAAVQISRMSEQNTEDAFIKKILKYSDSRRAALTTIDSSK